MKRARIILFVLWWPKVIITINKIEPIYTAYVMFKYNTYRVVLHTIGWIYFWRSILFFYASTFSVFCRKMFLKYREMEEEWEKKKFLQNLFSPVVFQIRPFVSQHSMFKFVEMPQKSGHWFCIMCPKNSRLYITYYVIQNICYLIGWRYVYSGATFIVFSKCSMGYVYSRL